jgi:hypothetical protein
MVMGYTNQLVSHGMTKKVALRDIRLCDTKLTNVYLSDCVRK